MSLYFARLACPSICASMATVNCTHRTARNTAMRLYLRDALISRQAIVSLTLYLVNFRSSRGGGVNRANNTNSERSIVSKTIAIVPIYCYRHSNLLLPFVLFHRQVFEGDRNQNLAVGYSRRILENVSGLLTFIFFSFTYDITITKLKKYLKNIDLKKFPSTFIV